jgi:hypothetical protein
MLALEILEDRSLLSVFTLPPSVFLGTGASPQSVAVGDFNGDGKPDVAVANHGNDNVSILLNAGNGSFQPPMKYSVSNPTEVISADLNGDGKEDLIVVDNTAPGAVSVLLGNGSGTFNTPVTYAVGNDPSGVVAVNLRNNGLLDLVVTNKGDNTISVLLNNGLGGFGPATSISVPSSPLSITSGDFDADGNQDVAIVANSEVDVLYGNGQGGFSATQATFSAGPGPGFIVSGDFNKDGKPDLAVANLFPFGNGVAVLLNNGNGTFASPVFYSLGTSADSGGSPTSNLMAVGDLTGNGKLDIVTADGQFANNDVSVLMGNGDGTFGNLTNWGADEQPVAVGIGDFNADGKPDLVVANLSSNDVSFLTGHGDDTFQAPRVYVNVSSPGPVVTGDFTGNGKQDIIVGNTSSLTGIVLTEYLGNGDGTFQAPITINASVATPALGQAVALAAVDVNGDGKLDLVMLDTNHNVDVFLGNGGGTFQTPAVYAGGANSIALAVGDFTGDGHPDIAVLNSPSSGNGSVNILLNNGDGTFSVFASSANAGITPSAIAAADLNGDGKADLVVSNKNGFSSIVSVLLSNGDGSFKVPVTYGVQADPTAVALGDLNGDGKPDIAVADFLGTGLDILLNNGDGTFVSAKSYQTGSNPSGVLIGNFMNQGHDDVMTTNDFGDSLTLWTNPGTGFLTGPLTFVVGDRPAMSAAVSFYGDGLLDVVTTNSNANSVTVLLALRQAPGITSASSTTFTVGTQGSFTVTDTGLPTPTLGVSGTLPVGVTFNASTGVLSGTPAAGTSGTYNLTFSANNDVGTASQNFTLTIFQPATISGTVFQDININGVHDSKEPGIAGVTVYLDLNNSGVLAGNDPTAITDGNGNFRFTITSAGTYTLRELLYGGVLLDSPSSGNYQLTVTSGANLTGKNFADVPTSIALPLTLPLTTPFPKQGDPDKDFVEALYRTLLVRNADPAGLASWTGLLKTGRLTRLGVVQGIRQSAEHFQDEVTDFYLTILNRAPDPTGLQNWVQALENGVPEEQIAADFLDSQEYLSKGDKYFVDHMYEAILGRAFDTTGEANWLNALGDNASGNRTHTPTATYQQVIRDFLYSPESLKRLVEGYYQIFLQRLADPTGLSNWLADLNGGTSFLTIAEGFLTSNEFYAAAAGQG